VGADKRNEHELEFKRLHVTLLLSGYAMPTLYTVHVASCRAVLSSNSKYFEIEQVKLVRFYSFTKEGKQLAAKVSQVVGDHQEPRQTGKAAQEREQLALLC